MANSNVSADSSGDDWPMFLHDSAHTGVTASAGPTEPVELWRFPVGNDVVSSAAVVDGIVYVGGNDNIYALNAYTGAEIWSYPTTPTMYSSPAVSGSRLFIGADGNVLALNALTGTKVWSYPTEGRVISSPAVVDGVVYVGSPEGNLYALNASTGSKIWNYTTMGAIEVQSSPAVVDGVVYYGSPDHNVYALKASTGEKIWNHTIRHIVNSAPAVNGGVVYVSTDVGYLYALDADSGEELWRFTVSDVLQRIHGYSPTVDDGVVYVRSSDSGELYALDALTGGLKWENRNRGSSYDRGSAAIVGDVVYIGTSALNASTGEEIWHFPTGDKVSASPAVSNGVLYVASRDGYFYAIGEPLANPPPNPSFPTAWILAAIALLTVFGIALIIYFKKRKH
ncbi:PQQ-binding-like beta-propeller repeat protein [Candidatus Bathyarchaeota archaeon]|nr:PQQ-binding-like beta-propeller repeat protein [Candidatus Bathyarchaeota archaeon]